MNADHAEACRLYATKLLGGPDGDWSCVGIDPEGIELQQGRTALRLVFPQRVTAPGPLRAVLKELAEQARAAESGRLTAQPALIDLRHHERRRSALLMQRNQACLRCMAFVLGIQGLMTMVARLGTRGYTYVL